MIVSMRGGRREKDTKKGPGIPEALSYDWSERLDSNQRPPAPKAGALPYCATLRDGMFCTQKPLLWQGRPIRRPQGPLPAPGKGTVSCSGQRPAGLFHTGRAVRQGAPPFLERKEHPVPLPCARGRSGRSFPMHSAQGRSRGVSVPASRPGHRRGPLAPFRPATAEKEKPRSKAGCISLWGERWDLNPRPPGPQPGALPTELLPP